ncbi:hypothetical protein FRC12_007964 [Ceratobasidium sp. 428]|nr:hypothetical protein FRC12_007964 [Ceratobasidium sp. 428]
MTSLLHVNRDFFFSVIRLLWRTVDGSNLLVLLPGVQYEYLPGNLVSDIPDLLPESYFDRFSLYAPYVRHLELEAATYRHKGPQGLSLVRPHAEARVLLPNLISLSIRELSPFRGPGIDALLDWLEVLISPSLRQLDLTPINRSPIHTAANRSYTSTITSLNSCSNLTELSFCYDHSSTADGLYATTPINLTSIRCHRAPFRLEFFMWLAGIPNLQRLEFSSPRSPSSSYAASLISELPTLAKLQSLSLGNCPSVFATSLFESPLVRNIVHLDMHCHSNDEWHSATITTTFFEQLSKICLKLTELVLDYSGLHQSPTLLSPLNNFRLLQTLPLQELSLQDCDRDMLGEPSIIREMLDIWPTLRELDIMLYEIDLEDLRMILPFCSRLSLLRLYIPVMLPVEISDEEFTHALSLQSGTAYSALKLCSHGDKDPEWDHSHSVLDQVSRYILSLRPNVTFWISNGYLKPSTPEPYEWADYLNVQLNTPLGTRRGGHEASYGAVSES